MSQVIAVSNVTRGPTDGNRRGMSFAPVIPFSGLQGWMYLEKTYDRQLEIYSQQAQLQRDVDYFKEKIGSISSAEELVSDRRLREVALGLVLSRLHSGL